MAAPLHILLVASTLDDDGGLPVCVAELAAALAGLGHRVEITGQYSTEIAPVIAGRAVSHGIEVTGFQRPWHLLGQLAAARGVAALVAERAATARATRGRLVVHNHGVWVPTVLAAANAAIARCHLVISPHGMLRAPALEKSRLKKQLVFRTLLRQQLLAAEAIQATSQVEADDLRALLPGCDPVIVPLGIVTPSATPRSRREPGAQRTAGYLGRILPIKNLEMLLHAWKTAAPDNWLLRIAGPGEPAYCSQLATLAATLGLADRVRFEPAVPHAALAEFFDRLDLFILPSKSEAFSLTVGEALAAGVPAIATTAAPWGGVVSHGCGWCVEPDQAAITQAIREATACDSATLTDMGQRGAAWVRHDYSWPAIAERHVRELYSAR
jgi:glycosyltransferase involved in cell wall biosynthesis